MPEKSDAEQFRKLFIGGVSYETTDETLKAYFEKWGEVVDCIVMRDPVSKKSRGFGFVTFKNASSVDEVQKKRPHTIDGKEVESKRAVPRSNNTPEAHVTVKKIFVGGLKEDLKMEDIEEYFKQYGAVEHVEMKFDKETNKQRGFCFVTFDDYDPVDKCVLMRNHTIRGVQIECKKALGKNEMINLMGMAAVSRGYQYNQYNSAAGNGGGYRFKGGRGRGAHASWAHSGAFPTQLGVGPVYPTNVASAAPQVSPSAYAAHPTAFSAPTAAYGMNGYEEFLHPFGYATQGYPGGPMTSIAYVGGAPASVAVTGYAGGGRMGRMMHRGGAAGGGRGQGGARANGQAAGAKAAAAGNNSNYAAQPSSNGQAGRRY